MWIRQLYSVGLATYGDVMNTRNKYWLFAALICFSGMHAAIAEEEGNNLKIRPMEILACNYNDGKNMDDLLRATGRWNSWMDNQNQDTYWAYILVPVYHSSEIDFDVAWVGGWKDGATMGASNEFWITKGESMQAEFAKVVTCNIHTNFAVLDVKASPDPWQSGPIEFSNCTIKDNRSFDDAIGAVHKWVAYQSENGIEAGHYALFPAYGESSEAEYNFKWVTGYSYEEFGKNYDQYGTGGGWRTAEELFGSLMDCDSARVYHGFPVRTVEIDQD